jgi:hypothetical protein
MEQDKKVEDKCMKCTAKRVLFFVLVLIALLLGFKIAQKLFFEYKVNKMARIVQQGMIDTLSPFSPLAQ